ncbi:MAG: tRNA (adenosine(37)-N6)-threonylcarbamoyltransferase complex dimerization subunit type 1 TsaB, partial [Luteolibacter sp.]
MDSLVIETSTDQASMVLVAADGRVEQRSFRSDRSHNALLFEPLSELLCGVSNLERVLVGSGPGSYSGTRVGIAAAQGIALAMNCPVVAIPSILAMPAAASVDGAWVIGDARRGTYWFARVQASRLLHEPELLDVKQLQAHLECADDRAALVTIDDPGRFSLNPATQSRLQHQFPDANGLWIAWQRADADTRHA